MSTPRPSRFRLPLDVRPSEYDLHVAPDLERGTFSGDVRITVTLAKARRSIVLHAADLVVKRASALLAHDELKARTTLDAHDETVTLEFPRALSKGEVTLSLAWTAKLNKHLRGLYAASSGDERYAFTQCEAADARRILPCFDEPSFKARFRVAVSAKKGDTVLSNAPIASEEPIGDGWRRVQFESTPPLSTYLLAIGVGPLEATAARKLGNTPIRVWHVPGKGHLAAFGLEAGYEALKRLEDYFGLPYPYDKLDLVAVPDFEAGAMENAGAVFFRETLLLLDPATVSMAERKRAAEVIAHELAHMWYGDLVTMAWWDDLWLNEAFATWMAYRVVDEWKPEWHMWQSFEHDRASALGLDALANTHPIYCDVRSVAEATENFDLITYEKGASVVRMIEHYLGADTFRDGVRRYMQKHRESNAVAADLWHALAEASGKDVTKVAQAWIEQSGFPLVTLGPAKDGALRVRQERFFSDPTTSAERRKVRWPVPLVLKHANGGKPKTVRHLVERASETLALGGGRSRWLYGNADGGGFYRVLHEGDAHAALLDNLSALTAVERLALVGDQWALVRAARATVESFLDVADALADETDHDVIDGMAAALAAIDDQVLVRGSGEQAAFRAWIAARFGPGLDALGWSAGKGEPDEVRLKRAALVRVVGGIGEAPAVLAEASRRLEGYLADRGSLEPNLADAVAGLAARVGDDALYDRYREVASAARTPQEQRRFLLSLPVFRTKRAIKRTLRSLLTSEVPTQDVSFLLMRMFSNPVGGPDGWTFLTKNWAALRRRVPPLMLSRLIDATPALREPRYARELRAFFKEHPLPEAARALKQASERFRLNAELRKRTAPGVAQWLAGRKSAAA